MGVRYSSPGRNHPSTRQWPLIFTPRQGIYPVARTKKKNMKFLLTIATILFCFFTFGSTAPQHERVRRGDGYIDVGGVYDSPAAQAYWASRFGAGFFTDLRALQGGINAAAASRRP